MNKFKVISVTLGIVLSSLSAYAQKAALSVNAGDAACLGTIGVEAGYAVAQKWSLNAGARFNPWTFHEGDAEKQSQLRQQTYSVGARFWPWYVYSGLWFGAKAQYQEYNRGGFNGKIQTEEGDAFGLGVEMGYSWLVTHAFNLNFGFGFWGGRTEYVRYDCPYCGRKTEEGEKMFFLPNELILGLVFVF